MCIFVHSSVSARLERSGPGSCLLPACDATRFRSLSAAARACLIHHHVVPVGAHNDPPTKHHERRTRVMGPSGSSLTSLDALHA
ncbi:hypothetical protein CHLRE_03g144927v5 [Chlamydomonas reinhardtii]|uniref:Uncharacterized protein n=1 Tax=Chlamydomonas reinhardtii TaxID=3055 RepID=A0A2K3DV91_CHLRE|nr:uncharacterized protein CHLRE_03g144927v5 [Chlamydomonas reinhardtii]PNW84439.1 hypothetical protein CHLRE_03g144927v5 [Chlamydomonas reinhardtii]